MYMQSLVVVDQYASNDPQLVLNKRIEFCMQLHNDAIMARTYPHEEKLDNGDFGDLDDVDDEKDLLQSLLEEMGMDEDFD